MGWFLDNPTLAPFGEAPPTGPETPTPPKTPTRPPLRLQPQPKPKGLTPQEEEAAIQEEEARLRAGGLPLRPSRDLLNITRVTRQPFKFALGAGQGIEALAKLPFARGEGVELREPKSRAQVFGQLLGTLGIPTKPLTQEELESPLSSLFLAPGARGIAGFGAGFETAEQALRGRQLAQAAARRGLGLAGEAAVPRLIDTGVLKVSPRVAGAAGKAAKEPWQMSLKEINELRGRQRFGQIDIRSNQAYRREFVEQALSEGKPVPPEVLAEYPGLAAKAAPAPAAAAPGGAKEPLKIYDVGGRSDSFTGGFAIADPAVTRLKALGYQAELAKKTLPPPAKGRSGFSIYSIKTNAPEAVVEEAKVWRFTPEGQAALTEELLHPAPAAAARVPTAEAVRPPVTPPEAAAGAGTRPPTVPPAAGGTVPPDDVIKRFTQFIHSPESLNLQELTVQMRSKQLGQRLAALQKRTDDLLTQGVKFEDALKQAQTETMAGQFDRPMTALTEAMAEEFRDAAFAKVYEVLAKEPLEQMSTAEALRNALAGKGIPRELGTAGGSAYTRLSRVFPPEVLAELEKGKPLAKALEDKLLLSPQHLDFSKWERFPSPELAAEQLPLERTPSALKGFGPRTYAEEIDAQLKFAELRRGPPIPFYEAPAITEALKQPSMMPLKDRYILVDALKEAGWTTMDIGNALRANLASVDASWSLRQQILLAPNNKRDFMVGNLSGWRAMFDKKFAETAMENIQRHKYYPLYEELAAKKGNDFLRPLVQKGLPAWQKEEAFMILGGERPIPRFMEKLPWIRLSQRGFVTATNEMNWRIFTRYADNLFAQNEKMALGRLKVPRGGFNIEKEISDFSGMLTDMTGRANLGPVNKLSGPMNAGFFSLRLNLGRLLTPRHLLSPNPRIRAEAAKNIVAFVGTIMGVEVLGEKLGLWDVEKNPLSADFAKLRIGDTRVDPWGGFQQFAVFAARIATGDYKASTTGIQESTDVLRTSASFVRTKLAPLASLFADLATGKTFLGEKTDVKNARQWAERITPFALGDMVDALNEEGIGGAAVASSALFGAGIATYPTPLVEYTDVPKTLPPDLKEAYDRYQDAKTPSAERTLRDTNPLVRQALHIVETRQQELRKAKPEIDVALAKRGRTPQTQEALSEYLKRVPREEREGEKERIEFELKLAEAHYSDAWVHITDLTPQQVQLYQDYLSVRGNWTQEQAWFAATGAKTIVRRVDKAVQAVRLQIRRANPDIEAGLVKFYGNKPLEAPTQKPAWLIEAQGARP